MTALAGTWTLAIDFGTSNTVCALHGPDGAIRPLLFDGSPLLPSAVYLDENGGFHVGRDALVMARLDPSRLERHPKRAVGRESILLGDSEAAVPAMLAAVFEAVRTQVERTLGTVPPAVLTCPAKWGPTNRRILVDAARAAGFTIAGTVTEPIAATAYFNQAVQRTDPSLPIVVYDLGGGTFDVAVLGPGDAERAVLAQDGHPDLGGVDIDQAIVAHLGVLVTADDPEVWERLSSPGDSGGGRDREVLRESVREAKEMLSRTATAPVAVPGVERGLHVTREELDRLAAPVIGQTVALTVRVIERAGLTAAGLGGLYLTGGASRMPLIARLLHTRLGIAPTLVEQPELPVAFGALAAAPANVAPQPVPPPPTAPPSPTQFGPPLGRPAAADHGPAPTTTTDTPLLAPQTIAPPSPPPDPSAKRRAPSRRTLLIALVLVLALIVPAGVVGLIQNLRDRGGSDGGGDGDGGDFSGPGDSIDFNLPEGEGELTLAFIPGWDEGVVATELWRQALEDAGYDVTVQEIAEAGVLFEGLASGDIDLFLDCWLPVTHAAYMEAYGDQVETIGTWYENAGLTVAVPSYVDEVDSLTELNDNADLFGNRIVGIEPSAGLTEAVLENTMPTYGITDLEMEDSSTASMLAELDSAIAAEEPIVVTLWQPHWAYAKYDLKNLEDPEETLGEVETINTLATAGFSEEHPELTEALGTFKMTDEQLADLEQVVFDEHDGDAEAGVTAWLEEHGFQDLFAA